MSEQRTLSYQRLFEVRLLHHYWLDDGATVFDLITDPLKKQQHLDKYDVERFLQLTPSANTQQQLTGLKALVTNTRHGFTVSIPQDTRVPLNSAWLWLIHITDPRFFAYTALTLGKQRLVELRHPLTHQQYRYKENVAVFSNLTGDSREQQLFLSQPLPSLGSNDGVESLIRSGNALKQLTSDQPGAQSKTLNSAWRKLPAYVHQGDIPMLIAPAGLTEVPTRGIELNDDIPSSVYALIRLSPQRLDKPEFSWLDNNGLPKSSAPVFEIRFKNRATYWRYLNKATGLPSSQEANPLPLTYFGNAGSKQKPPPQPPKIIKSGERIVRLNSDIYV